MVLVRTTAENKIIVWQKTGKNLNISSKKNDYEKKIKPSGARHKVFREQTSVYAEQCIVERSG
jgi:hypothetical protein